MPTCPRQRDREAGSPLAGRARMPTALGTPARHAGAPSSARPSSARPSQTEMTPNVCTEGLAYIHWTLKRAQNAVSYIHWAHFRAQAPTGGWRVAVGGGPRPADGGWQQAAGVGRRAPTSRRRAPTGRRHPAGSRPDRRAAAGGRWPSEGPPRVAMPTCTSLIICQLSFIVGRTVRRPHLPPTVASGYPRNSHTTPFVSHNPAPDNPFFGNYVRPMRSICVLKWQKPPFP